MFRRLDLCMSSGKRDSTALGLLDKAILPQEVPKKVKSECVHKEV